jgi:hypothetical protein
MAINKTDFDQLMNQARIKLVGASDAGLLGELYDVLSEFFNDSRSWTQDITVPYQPNTQSYPVQPIEGQIISLVGVSDWGPVVPPTTIVPNPNTSFVPALMPDLGTLVLMQAPNVSGYYQVTVCTNVSLPTDRHQMPIAPSWVLPIWHVGILDGLLGKMMSQPGKAYANDKQSAYHLKRFRDAIARARIAKMRANTNGAAAWRFPQQFRAASQQSGVPAIGSANERSF